MNWNGTGEGFARRGTGSGGENRTAIKKFPRFFVSLFFNLGSPLRFLSHRLRARSLDDSGQCPSASEERREPAASHVRGSSGSRRKGLMMVL